VVLQARGLRVVDRHGVRTAARHRPDIRAGEILGIAGVAGNGQSELLEVLAGMIPGEGTVTMNGAARPEPAPRRRPCPARALGIAHVHEDRHRCGLVLNFMAWENIAFGYHHAPEYQKNALLMDNAAILKDARGKMERFDVRPPNPMLTAESFSGGNQQKIVLAREIERNPDLLLVGQPTRGVDIGAIEFIHQQLIALRDQGKAILLVSVELDEILSLSDRIAVMFDGRIMGERLPDQTNARELGLLMAGVTGTAA
jgi:general nucleoside transport system ATP-binding protein